jgi:phospholipid-binding lipoprotein MlaA
MRYLIIFILSIIHINAMAASYQNRDCSDLYDPLEPVNRKVFIFNGVFDYIVSKPLARGYQKLVPKPAKAKVENFVKNLYTPVTFVNNILQLNFPEAIKSFWKFTFNSTFGILGFNDLTTKRGLKVKKQSFGATLAHYGARPGIYIVVPFFGGTNLRDMLDLVFFDKALNPVIYQIPDNTYLAITGVTLLHKRAAMLPTTDQIEKNSADPYIAIRSMLHQKRENELEYPKERKCITITE